MLLKNGKYVLNTKTAIEFDCGSTGSTGHFTTQGNRKGYVTLHRDGSITTAEIGSGYFYSPRTSGYDWQRSGLRVETHSVADRDDVTRPALEALADAGKIPALDPVEHLAWDAYWTGDAL